MHRITPRSTAFRAYGGSSRATVSQGDDGHMMQEIAGGLMHGESRKKMEFVQNYGMTAAILPATQGQGGGSGGGGGAPMMAEAIISYVGGNRSLPMITGIDDRRHRPYGLKPGETAQYDDQQQMTYMKRDGLYMLSHLKASLRHIDEKQKQKRPPAQQQQSQGGGSGGQEQEDPKHEGTPTSEVLAEKSKITSWGKEKVILAVPSADKPLVVVVDGKVYLGGDPGTGTFALVSTVSGPSVNVYAKIS